MVCASTALTGPVLLLDNCLPRQIQRWEPSGEIHSFENTWNSRRNDSVSSAMARAICPAN